MEVVEFFLKLCLVLVAAKASGEAFAWLGLPAVIGEVAAGIVIGPSVLGVIGQEQVFLLIANAGILLLLFQVGLETDVGKLIAVGGQATMVAVTGLALPFVLGYAACRHGFGLSPVTSMFAGGTLVATSIGITLRVLRDLGKRQTTVAQVVLGAAVIDDVIGVIVLAVLIGYARAGGVQLASSFRVLLFIAIFLMAAHALGPLLERVLTRVGRLSKTTGAVTTVIVAFILVLSVLAREFGAPEIIGAFAAGLALTGRSRFFGGGNENGGRRGIAFEVEGMVGPIAELFVPVFFVMVGVSINFSAIDFGSPRFWMFAGSLTALAFISKMLSGVFVKGPLSKKAAVGVAMIPRGEVGLIFAKTGLEGGIFDDAVYASMVFVVALTTLFAPVFLKGLMKGKE